MQPRPAGMPLDLRDSSVLKAIGILAIVFHNFFHHLPFAATENEFHFNPKHFPYFLAAVADPHQTIQALFSYFGHFGVQLFIFLSAYGLALSYWSPQSRSAFVWSRIRKLYPTYLLALGLFLLLKLVQDGPAKLGTFLYRAGDELVLTTLGVLTLLPGYGLPPVGPWWFLPFIVQFYCIWGVLAWFSRRFGLAGLATLSVLSLGLTFVSTTQAVPHFRINLLMTPIGHLPELALGIACARFGFRVGAASALPAALIFLLGNLDVRFWPLTYVTALVLALSAYNRVAPLLRASRTLGWIGEISMPLFFVNGFLRGPFWAGGRSGVWYLQLAFGLAFALVSLGVAYVVWLAERRLVPPRGTPARLPA